jgi:hypothetical protein
LPVHYSQTDRSKLFIEIAAIHSSQTCFLAHQFRKVIRTALILKDTQCAGFCRKDCKVHGDASAASRPFHNNMSVQHAAASRLRSTREDRPVGLRGCRNREKEKGISKTHESDEAHVPDAVRRITNCVRS